VTGVASSNRPQVGLITFKLDNLLKVTKKNCAVEITKKKQKKIASEVAAMVTKPVQTDECVSRTEL
jgi:hypothetical protein